VTIDSPVPRFALYFRSVRSDMAQLQKLQNFSIKCARIDSLTACESSFCARAILSTRDISRVFAWDRQNARMSVSFSGTDDGSNRGSRRNGETRLSPVNYRQRRDQRCLCRLRHMESNNDKNVSLLIRVAIATNERAK